MKPREYRFTKTKFVIEIIYFPEAPMNAERRLGMKLPNYDRAFSATLLTEARVGVAHHGNSATPTEYGTDYATQVGIPGVNISQFTSGQAGIILGRRVNSCLVARFILLVMIV